MPFKVKEPGELVGLQPGDKILFRLRVTDTESWVEGISKIGGAPTPKESKPAGAPAAAGHERRSPGIRCWTIRSPTNWGRR